MPCFSVGYIHQSVFMFGLYCLSADTFIPVTALSAAGYRNNSTGALTNVGTNGNYWSASPNGTNGYYLNFNSTNVNPANNNNRANGFSVRCVAAFISIFNQLV